MADMNPPDPFLQVQSEVLTTLQTTRPLFSSFLRIRSTAKSPQNPELSQSRSELEHTLSELSADLDDLVESVRAVESDPYRYGLEIDEVSRRRGFVDDVGKEVEKMRGELDVPFHAAGAGGGAGSGGGAGLPDPDEFEMRDEDADAEGGDHYAAMEQQRQSDLMAEQDQQLNGVYRTVGNLRDQATDMGRELEEQTGMLGEVDNLADRVGGKLSSGMSKMKYVIRKNEDTMSSFCIAALIFVLVLLLILVIVL